MSASTAQASEIFITSKAYKHVHAHLVHDDIHAYDTFNSHMLSKELSEDKHALVINNES